MVNKPKGQSEVCRLILDNHYDWCKKEGRDTSWFKRRKGDDLLEPEENKRVKRKRS